MALGEALEGALGVLTAQSFSERWMPGTSLMSVHKWGKSLTTLMPGTLLIRCSGFRETGMNPPRAPAGARAACANCPPGWAGPRRLLLCARPCVGH